MVYKLYGDMLSPPVRAVYFTLKMLNIEVEFVNVDLLSKENTDEKFLEVIKYDVIFIIIMKRIPTYFILSCKKKMF